MTTDIVISDVLTELLPPAIKESIQQLPQDLINMDRDKLTKKLHLTKIEKQLKKGFWKEYTDAQHDSKRISLAAVCKNVCSYNHFKRALLEKPDKLAWLLKPELSDEVNIELLYDKGMTRLEEILDIDIYSKGEIDTRKVEVVLKAVKMIEERFKGKAIERTENKNLIVKVEDTITDGNRESKILEIRKRLGQIN